MSNPPPTSDLNKLKLNPGAMSFVPGQNFNAPTFVPGGFAPPPAAAPQAAPKEEPKVEQKQAEDEEDWDKEEAKPEEEEPKVEEKPVVEEKSEPVDNDEPKDENKEEVADEPDEGEAVEEEEVQLDFVNIVFIGHVDAGKSTMSGQILKVTGMVDARTLEKYERESKEKNRESWALSWWVFNLFY